MTLTQLRYIVSIVDAGLNITAAAERIHATQPGISKQLGQLEGELGFQVFTRRGKSLIGITPAGCQVIVRARAILEEAHSIRSLAANLRGDDQGELTILTTHTQARCVLPEALRQFKCRYPRVALHLRPHGDARILSQFAEGKADLALISRSGESVPADGLAVPVFRWSRVVVVPVSHPLAQLTRPLRLADLAAQPLVSYDSSLHPGSSLSAAFVVTGVRPQFVCTSSDAELIKTYVRAGLGVGILAEMAMQAADSQDLKVLDASALLPECTTWLVLRKNRVLPSYTLALVELLAPHIDARQVHAAQSGDIADPVWPEPPRWLQLQAQARRAYAVA